MLPRFLLETLWTVNDFGRTGVENPRNQAALGRKVDAVLEGSQSE